MLKMLVNNHAIHSPREMEKRRVGIVPDLEVVDEGGLGGDGPAQSRAPPSSPLLGNDQRRHLSGILNCLPVLEEKVADPL